jgi:hypothetical protein
MTVFQDLYGHFQNVLHLSCLEGGRGPTVKSVLPGSLTLFSIEKKKHDQVILSIQNTWWGMLYARVV